MKAQAERRQTLVLGVYAREFSTRISVILLHYFLIYLSHIVNNLTFVLCGVIMTPDFRHNAILFFSGVVFVLFCCFVFCI